MTYKKVEVGLKIKKAKKVELEVKNNQRQWLVKKGKNEKNENN